MKLDCVLTAVNENKLYIDFIPLFIKTWKKLYPNVDILIILIANEIPKSEYNFEKYKENIILFPPIENISTAFTSQYIRLLYPCILNYKNGILITDIDMIPLNKNYFTKNILEITDNKFIYYRENAISKEYKQIAITYNIALPSTWQEIFQIKSLEDIKERLKKINKGINYIDGHNLSGWCTDQEDLYKYIINWNNKNINFICLKDDNTNFKRLDRHRFDINDNKIREDISNGVYTDYHCLRPMKEFDHINNIIYDLL